MKYPILTLFADGGDSGAVGESNAQAGLAEDIKTGDNTESDSCCEYDEDVLEKEFDELIQGEKSADNTDISLEKIRLTERAARVYAGWERESELLKNEYPDFDLRSEAKNPRFVRLIRAGAGIKEAYEVIHRDSLLSERLKNAVIAEVTKRWNEIEERKSKRYYQRIQSRNQAKRCLLFKKRERGSRTPCASRRTHNTVIRKETA